MQKRMPVFDDETRWTDFSERRDFRRKKHFLVFPKCIGNDWRWFSIETWVEERHLDHKLDMYLWDPIYWDHEEGEMV